MLANHIRENAAIKIIANGVCLLGMVRLVVYTKICSGVLCNIVVIITYVCGKNVV